jgi:DNA-directed RNA polymerase subunit RPC12/RpoP
MPSEPLEIRDGTILFHYDCPSCGAAHDATVPLPAPNRTEPETSTPLDVRCTSCGLQEQVTIRTQRDGSAVRMTIEQRPTAGGAGPNGLPRVEFRGDRVHVTERCPSCHVPFEDEFPLPPPRTPGDPQPPALESRCPRCGATVNIRMFNESGRTGRQAPKAGAAAEAPAMTSDPFYDEFARAGTAATPAAVRRRGLFGWLHRRDGGPSSPIGR